MRRYHTVVPFHNLRLEGAVPFHFAPKIWLDVIPDSLREDKLLDRASEYDLQRFNICTHCLVIEYEADALYSPDPNWKGDEPRPVEQANIELAYLANVALWLQHPSPTSFTLLFHMPEYDKFIIQGTERCDGFLCHPNDENERIAAESAGKRFSGRTRKGDRYLRRILVQSAWAAARTKDCFLRALFFRIAARRGLKKAAVAVAHRILVIAWKIIREGGEYQERGGDYFDRRDPQRTARKLTRRLENIGFTVDLTPRQPATPRPVVDISVCRKCARWGLPQCLHYFPKPKRTNRPRKPKDSAT